MTVYGMVYKNTATKEPDKLRIYAVDSNHDRSLAMALPEIDVVATFENTLKVERSGPLGTITQHWVFSNTKKGVQVYNHTHSSFVCTLSRGEAVDTLNHNFCRIVIPPAISAQMVTPGVEVKLPHGDWDEPALPVCECGAEKCGSNRHSDWCQKA